MQKFIICCFLALLSLSAHAQSDYAATWTMSGIDFGTELDDQLLLDLNVGTRFVAVNGIMLDDEGDAYTVTGSCYFTTGDLVLCTLALDIYTLEVAIDLLDGEGLVQLIDYDGFPLDEGVLSLTGVE